MTHQQGSNHNHIVCLCSSPHRVESVTRTELLEAELYEGLPQEQGETGAMSLGPWQPRLFSQKKRERFKKKIGEMSTSPNMEVAECLPMLTGLRSHVTCVAIDPEVASRHRYVSG